jgi:hypothetical protein
VVVKREKDPLGRRPVQLGQTPAAAAPRQCYVHLTFPSLLSGVGQRCCLGQEAAAPLRSGLTCAGRVPWTPSMHARTSRIDRWMIERRILHTLGWGDSSCSCLPRPWRVAGFLSIKEWRRRTGSTRGRRSGAARSDRPVPCGPAPAWELRTLSAARRRRDPPKAHEQSGHRWLANGDRGESFTTASREQASSKLMARVRAWLALVFAAAARHQHARAAGPAAVVMTGRGGDCEKPLCSFFLGIFDFMLLLFSRFQSWRNAITIHVF